MCKEEEEDGKGVRVVKAAKSMTRDSRERRGECHASRWLLYFELLYTDNVTRNGGQETDQMYENSIRSRRRYVPNQSPCPNPPLAGLRQESAPASLDQGPRLRARCPAPAPAPVPSSIARRLEVGSGAQRSPQTPSPSASAQRRKYLGRHRGQVPSCSRRRSC